MVVTFYQLTKKRNSTKHPATADQKKQYMGVMLKGGCSILNPVIILGRNISGTEIEPVLWNYCSIDDFYRWYFIDDWVFNNDCWEAHLSCDVLASWRTDIRNMTQYINRASILTNGTIVDNLYPATSLVSVQKTAITNPMEDLDHGCYIVGLLSGETGDCFGAATYYALNNTNVAKLREDMFGSGILSGLEITASLARTITNPADYLVSCMWFPVKYSDITGTDTSVKFGWWQSTAVGKRIKPENGIKRFSSNVTLPDHPQIARGSYLNKAPYTRRTLYFQPFGTIPINTMDIDTTDTLKIYVDLDFISGYANLSLFTRNTNGDERLISKSCAMTAVPAVVGKSGSDAFGAVGSVISAAGSIAAGNYAGAAGGIGNALASFVPTPEKVGASGSLVAHGIQDVQITSEFIEITDEAIGHYGRPVCTEDTLSNYEYESGVSSGYIQISDPDINLDCYESERTMIENFMREGFFLE